MFDRDDYMRLGENDQYKELYAYLGLTVSHLQALEDRLFKLMFIVEQLENSEVTTENYLSKFYENCECYPELILQRIELLSILSSEECGKLRSLIMRRGYILHRILLEKGSALYRIEGRVELIKELQNYSAQALELEKVLAKQSSIISRKLASYKTGIEEWMNLLYIKGPDSKRFVF